MVAKLNHPTSQEQIKGKYNLINNSTVLEFFNIGTFDYIKHIINIINNIGQLYHYKI